MPERHSKSTVRHPIRGTKLRQIAPKHPLADGVRTRNKPAGRVSDTRLRELRAPQHRSSSSSNPTSAPESVTQLSNDRCPADATQTSRTTCGGTTRTTKGSGTTGKGRDWRLMRAILRPGDSPDAVDRRQPTVTDQATAPPQHRGPSPAVAFQDRGSPAWSASLQRFQAVWRT